MCLPFGYVLRSTTNCEQTPVVGIASCEAAGVGRRQAGRPSLAITQAPLAAPAAREHQSCHHHSGEGLEERAKLIPGGIRPEESGGGRDKRFPGYERAQVAAVYLGVYGTGGNPIYRAIDAPRNLSPGHEERATPIPAAMSGATKRTVHQPPLTGFRPAPR